jgi:tetratricopeptide (TPR) repeat protein
MKQRLPLLLIVFSIILLFFVQGYISSFLRGRTLEEKLGYVPSKRVLRMVVLDHQSLMSSWLLFKVITYYGGKIDPKIGSFKDIEYYNMYRFIDAATDLDPYNIDAYYFAEAVFTWGLGRIKEVNRILERGLRYRTWDHYIPCFMGFNYFYFLKDYKRAAKYLRIAAGITKSAFFTSLTSRMLYEAQQTEVAIEFIQQMIKEIKNNNLRRSLEVRLEALKAIAYLEKGVKEFKERYKRLPHNLEEMVGVGVIEKIPHDPYGGNFYIDSSGRIKTTSKLARQPKRRG